MKKLICSLIVIGFAFQVLSQQQFEDEINQARVHYMNDAKVSYVTSAEVYQVLSTDDKDPEIPVDIRRSFKDKYQAAKNVEWVIKEDRYKINFNLEGSEMFAYLDRHGIWIKSFTKLTLEELPQLVASYLDIYYADYQLTKYYLKTTPNGQSYTVAVKGNKEYVWLEFDENGHVVNSPA